MTVDQIIRRTYAGMVSGKRFSPKECNAFRDAIWREANDGKIEAMMLFFAESLHDTGHCGKDEIARVLRDCDQKMLEFIEKADDGTWNMDDLRVRVFGKTGFMFAMSREDQEHIVQVLTAAGYDVSVDEPEEVKDDVQVD